MQGAVRAWANNRFGVVVREAHEASTPDHLYNILADMERRDGMSADLRCVAVLG